jgi:hypothetical protein
MMGDVAVELVRAAVNQEEDDKLHVYPLNMVREVCEEITAVRASENAGTDVETTVGDYANRRPTEIFREAATEENEHALHIYHASRLRRLRRIVAAGRLADARGVLTIADERFAQRYGEAQRKLFSSMGLTSTAGRVDHTIPVWSTRDAIGIAGSGTLLEGEFAYATWDEVGELVNGGVLKETII